VDLVRLSAATLGLGIGQPEQVGLAEQGEDLAREARGLLRLGGPRGELLAHDLADEPQQLGRLVGGQDAGGGHGTSGRLAGVRREEKRDTWSIPAGQGGLGWFLHLPNRGISGRAAARAPDARRRPDLPMYS